MSATISYPTGAPTHSVELAGPVLGDSKITPQEVKLHQTLSGIVVTTFKSVSRSTKFLLTFPNVTLTQWASLLSLVETARGDNVRVIIPSGDYILRIMDNPIKKATPNPVRYSVSIELVGYESDSTRRIKLVNESGYLLTTTGDYVLRLEE